MAESIEFLVGRLRSEGDKALEFWNNLQPGQWEVEIYSDGEVWTIRNLLVHFVTAEKGFLKIFSDIINGGPGVREDFDIDRYNSSQQKKNVDISTAELIGEFRVVREEMIRFVIGLKDTDLLKVGRHPFLGQVALLEMVKLIYRHNQLHLRDIRKLLESN